MKRLIICLLYTSTVDSDTDFQVQANYYSYNLAYRFYSGCENYCFSDGSSVNGESRQVWKNGYTGNVAEYDIVNEEEGCLWQGWQGLYCGRMGRVSLSEQMCIRDSYPADPCNRK